MGAFLRENWLWIAAPILLVVALIVVAIVQGQSGDAPFIYQLGL